MEYYWGIVITLIVIKLILLSIYLCVRFHRRQQVRVVVVQGSRQAAPTRDRQQGVNCNDQMPIVAHAAPMGTSAPPRPPAGQYPPCPPPAYSRDPRGPYPHSQYPGARPPPANVHGSAPYVKQGPGPARRDPHDDPCLLQA
ncbi:uncharacterized protein LOC143300433 isoform X1 [Babylonia areolata]|uniref:uncharacterized protein LOC143300433 isoform X1 n=1 Tax=Babylonia areolata TaxID=304850 RepID=UPI003FD4E4BF